MKNERKDKLGKKSERNMWIVKPSHSNNGEGIRIFEDDVTGIFNYMTTFSKLSIKNNSGKPTFIVQKYLERPLLMKK